MNQKPKNKQARGGRLIVGALVGTVLSLGAVAGSASAESAELSNDVADVVVVKTGTGVRVVGGYTSMRSGIRW